MNFFPTPYAEVNAALTILSENVRTTLGDELVGLYLHGSLAGGDFNPLCSDIDFMAAVRSDLSMEMQTALRDMHKRVAEGAAGWLKKIEGSYIPLKALRRFDPTMAIYPVLGTDGHFALEFHGSEWIIQRHVLRQHGIVLCGPAPQILIDPISPAELRKAAAGILQEWWAPRLEDPSLLYSREYQAYAALTMCRALYTLHFGEIVSKPVAARWAASRLTSAQAALIETALTWPEGPQPDQLAETLEFIQYTLKVATR